MTNTGLGRSKACDFVRVEMDTVGQPGARAQPADAVQVINGPQAKPLEAEVFFVEGFRQVGVQPDVELFGQRRTFAHDFWCDRER